MTPGARAYVGWKVCVGVVHAKRSMHALLKGRRKSACRLCRSFCVSSNGPEPKGVRAYGGRVCEGNSREWAHLTVLRECPSTGPEWSPALGCELVGLFPPLQSESARLAALQALPTKHYGVLAPNFKQQWVLMVTSVPLAPSHMSMEAHFHLPLRHPW